MLLLCGFPDAAFDLFVLLLLLAHLFDVTWNKRAEDLGWHIIHFRKEQHLKIQKNGRKSSEGCQGMELTPEYS